MVNFENSETYKNIIESLPEGVILCDSSFNVVFINKTLQELSGFCKEELIGETCAKLIQIDKTACPICTGKTDSVFIPEQFVHQADLVSKDNEKIPVKITHNIIEGEQNAYLTTVSPLADAICLNQAHMDFVSTVSHELRTPLTSIKGFVDTLLMSGDMLPKEQQTRFIGIIKAQIERLTRLVEDLLTVSRLETRRDNDVYKAVDVVEAVEPIIQGLKNKAPNHYFDLDIKPDLPRVWVDSDKFEQVMTNLIDNAVKYSYSKTTVTIKANYVENDTDLIDIKVIDQGVGIPKEHLSNLFNKFSRIDNPLTREVQGTGLGLYITKALVEKMKGKISVESNDRGTSFSVQMPVATCESHANQKFS